MPVYAQFTFPGWFLGIVTGLSGMVFPFELFVDCFFNFCCINKQRSWGSGLYFPDVCLLTTGLFPLMRMIVFHN
jgi:hypothetical protein